MPETEEPDRNEQLNPDEGGPFSLGKLIGRNRREVIPDANKLQVLNLTDKEGLIRRGREWFLNHHGPLTLIIIFILGLSYAVPERYDQQLTNLVFGLVFAAIVITLSAAYEYEKRQDLGHNVFVDKIKIKLKETIVSREKSKDGNVETKVLVPRITEREIHLAKDYMFEGKKGDPYKIEKYNCQIVGTFGKIIDVSEIDDTGRILIGEGDGDIPSGLILKVAYPSRTELSQEVKRAEKLYKEGAVDEKKFLKFKQVVDQYNLWRDQVIEMAQREGVAMIDLDAMSKKQKSFFVGLAKDSMDYWNGTDQDAISLKEWKAMDPSVATPKILALMRDYNDIKAQKLDLVLNRESDKMESELGATLNLMEATGQSEEAINQYLVEMKKGLVSVTSRTDQELERDVNGRREE